MEQQNILIDNQQEKTIQTRVIMEKTKQILNALGCNSHEISIVLTDDTVITGLNNQFRNIDKPTNVLAFPMQEGRFTDISPGLLGDLVISCETAAKEADAAGITLEERLSQLLVHGTLHLVGFDHETSEADEQKMEEKSIELLRTIEENKNLTSF